MNFIRIKTVCSVKDPVKRVKRQATDWDKTFVKHISDEELVCRTYKELSKLNSKKTKQSDYKMDKRHGDISPKWMYRGKKHRKSVQHC